MADFLGDFAAGATVRVWWNTNAIAGESITRATDGDIRIYKNGSDAQRSSSAGITDSEDVDSITGVHRLSIDLSDDTDTGFYAAGGEYAVVLVAATIDGKAINHALAQFSIANRPVQGMAVSVITAIAAGIDLAGIPAAVWAYATASATVVGSMGKALVDFITYATTKLALITAGAVNFTAPVDPDTLTLTIVRGDDYSDDSGRTLPTWESDDWSVLDLSAATSVTFKATTRYGTVFSKAMDILSDTQVRLQLTTAETAALGVGTNAYRYDLEAVLSAAKGSDIITLAQGMMTVREDVR